jgi:homoserine acetyltransferase
VGAARTAAADATYREIRSDKGHDAFLVEWDQVAAAIGEALAERDDPIAASA